MSLRRPLPLLPATSLGTVAISLKTPATVASETSAAPEALLSEMARRNGLQGLSYAGAAAPCTVLTSGEEAALDALRGAWARGALRAPAGYTVLKLGDVSGSLWLHPVAPAAFAPLSEALLQCVPPQRPTSAEALRRALRRAFPRMRPPDPDALHAALGQLVRERRICHNGQGYLLVQACCPFVDSDTRLVAGGRRSLSVQVDETDIPLAAPTREVACQITQVVPSPDLQRCHSLKAPRPRLPPDGGSFDRSFSEKRRNDLSRHRKGDKQGESVLSKLLRRMQQSLSEGKSSRVPFSAQFPPPEWAGQVTVGHSVATQTLLLQKKGISKSPIKKLDIPWMDIDLDTHGLSPCFHKSKPRTNGSSPNRPSSRRRHHRRRSSSESPKSRKPKNRSSDPSDAKMTLSSSSGEPNNQKDSNKSDEFKVNEASKSVKGSKAINDRSKFPLKSVAFQTPKKTMNAYVLDPSLPLSIDEDTGENATPSLASEFDSSLSAILSDPKMAASEDSSSFMSSTPPLPAKRSFPPKSTTLLNGKNTIDSSRPYCIKEPSKNGKLKSLVLRDNPQYGTLNPNILRTLCPQNVPRPEQSWRKSGISLTPTVLKNNSETERKQPNSPPEKDTPGHALTWKGMSGQVTGQTPNWNNVSGNTNNWKDGLKYMTSSLNKNAMENNAKTADKEKAEENKLWKAKPTLLTRTTPPYFSPVLKNLTDFSLQKKFPLQKDAGISSTLSKPPIKTPKLPILKKLIDIPSVKTTLFSTEPPKPTLKIDVNTEPTSKKIAPTNDKPFTADTNQTDILISHYQPQDLTTIELTDSIDPSPADGKALVVDNSVSVEVEVQKKGVGGQSPVATVVTEETTTVSKGKVVTVTSITTSLSHGKIRDLGSDGAGEVNDLNAESRNVVDCSSSCNIVTEVK